MISFIDVYPGFETEIKKPELEKKKPEFLFRNSL